MHMCINIHIYILKVADGKRHYRAKLPIKLSLFTSLEKSFMAKMVQTGEEMTSGLILIWYFCSEDLYEPQNNCGNFMFHLLL